MEIFNHQNYEFFVRHFRFTIYQRNYDTDYYVSNDPCGRIIIFVVLRMYVITSYYVCCNISQDHFLGLVTSDITEYCISVLVFQKYYFQLFIFRRAGFLRLGASK
jgi:hypothetical protein